MLRSLREGIDTANAAGRMIAGVLASLAELELELGRERRTSAPEARKARGQYIGRPDSRRSDIHTGPTDARSRGTGHHHRLNAGRQPGHRVPGTGTRLRVLTATPWGVPPLAPPEWPRTASALSLSGNCASTDWPRPLECRPVTGRGTRGKLMELREADFIRA